MKNYSISIKCDDIKSLELIVLFMANIGIYSDKEAIVSALDRGEISLKGNSDTHITIKDNLAKIAFISASYMDLPNIYDDPVDNEMFELFKKSALISGMTVIFEAQFEFCDDNAEYVHFGKCSFNGKKLEYFDSVNIGSGEPIEHVYYVEYLNGEIITEQKNAFYKYSGKEAPVVMAFNDIENYDKKSDSKNYKIENGILKKYVGRSKKAIIPDGVKIIDDGAFEHCVSLTSITIPISVTKICECAFSDCKKLENIEVEKGNKIYHSNGNCLIETKSKTLILGCKTSIIPIDGSVKKIGECAFANCVGLTNIALPDCITKIEEYAFSGCESLMSINIPNGIKKISKYVFYNCTNLLNITLPDTVTHICESAFENCKSLIEFIIPNSVTNIDNSAFHNCVGLSTIVIGESVKRLFNHTFNGCISLTNITIPNSVTRIGNQAFYRCTQLKSVTVGNGMTSIENTAFEGCDSLEHITVSKGNSNFYSAGNCVVDIESGSVIIGCKSSVIPIDESVTAVGKNAFSNCKFLTDMIIPENITSIEEMAFMSCENLVSIYIPKSVTTMGWAAFLYCDRLTIHAPAGSYAEQYAKENNIPFVAE